MKSRKCFRLKTMNDGPRRCKIKMNVLDFSRVARFNVSRSVHENIFYPPRYQSFAHIFVCRFREKNGWQAGKELPILENWMSLLEVWLTNESGVMRPQGEKEAL